MLLGCVTNEQLLQFTSSGLWAHNGLWQLSDGALQISPTWGTIHMLSYTTLDKNPASYSQQVKTIWILDSTGCTMLFHTEPWEAVTGGRSKSGEKSDEDIQKNDFRTDTTHVCLEDAVASLWHTSTRPQPPAAPHTTLITWGLTRWILLSYVILWLMQG